MEPTAAKNLPIERFDINEIEMPLRHAFETSFGVTTGRRVLIVSAVDSEGNVGFGECTAMEQPFYNPESVDAAWEVMIRSIFPLLSRGQIATAADVSRVLEPIKGNRMAIAAVETAIWDLEAKRAGVPLWQILGGTRPSIDCGVSIGIQKNVDELIDRVAAELDAGYQRIKIKIKPDHDVRLVEAVRKRYPDIVLSVDANSAYVLDRDLEVMKALDRYDLLMIEQPLEAGDLIDHAKLQKHLNTPLCLDESITSFRDARQAVEIGACRIINIKLGRVGGHTESRRIQELAVESGIPVWCGGMLETGIGRAHNIAMSTLAGFTLPGDVSASHRYWKQDIVEPPITVSPTGTISAPTNPGIGFDVNTDLIRSTATRNISIEHGAHRRLRPRDVVGSTPICI